MPESVVWQVFWVALFTDLATGLGALPFAFVRRMSVCWQGRMTSAAAGMMLSASVFTLTGEALKTGRLWHVLVGLLSRSRSPSTTFPRGLRCRCRSGRAACRWPSAQATPS